MGFHKVFYFLDFCDTQIFSTGGATSVSAYICFFKSLEQFVMCLLINLLVSIININRTCSKAAQQCATMDDTRAFRKLAVIGRFVATGFDKVSFSGEEWSGQCHLRLSPIRNVSLCL